MRLRYLMIASAIVYAIFGVAFLLAAGLVLALYGGMSMEPLTDHLFGAALVGFAVVNWLVRDASGGPAVRGVIAANLAFNALAFVSILVEQLSGAVNALGWSSVLVSLLLTVGFAYVLFVKPIAASESAMAAPR